VGLLGILFVVAWFSVQFGCAMYVLVAQSKMMAQVNARLPEEQKFYAGVWGPGKKARFGSEYERLFPGAPLTKRIYVAMAIFFANGVLLFAVVLLSGRR